MARLILFFMFLLAPASNPYFVDPFGGMPFVLMAYSFFDDFGAPLSKGATKTSTGVLGANIDLAGDWRATVAATVGEEKLHFEMEVVDRQALAAALADTDPATAWSQVRILPGPLDRATPG